MRLVQRPAINATYSMQGTPPGDLEGACSVTIRRVGSAKAAILLGALIVAVGAVAGSVAIGAGVAGATSSTWIVAPVGDTGACTTSYHTIGAAVSAATTGDTISVWPAPTTSRSPSRPTRT